MDLSPESSLSRNFGLSADQADIDRNSLLSFEFQRYETEDIHKSVLCL